MTMNGRGQMRPGHANKTPSFIFIGLIVVIAILGFNYWSVTARNNVLTKELTDMNEKLHMTTVRKLAVDKRNEAFSLKQQELESELERQKTLLENQVQEASNLNTGLSQARQEAEEAHSESNSCNRNLETCISEQQEQDQKAKILDDEKEAQLEECQNMLRQAEQDLQQQDCTKTEDAVRLKILNTVVARLGMDALRSLGEAGISTDGIGTLGEPPSMNRLPGINDGQPAVNLQGQPQGQWDRQLPQQQQQQPQQQLLTTGAQNRLVDPAATQPVIDHAQVPLGGQPADQPRGQLGVGDQPHDQLGDQPHGQLAFAQAAQQTQDQLGNQQGAGAVQMNQAGLRNPAETAPPQILNVPIDGGKNALPGDSGQNLQPPSAGDAVNSPFQANQGVAFGNGLSNQGGGGVGESNNTQRDNPAPVAGSLGNGGWNKPVENPDFFPRQQPAPVELEAPNNTNQGVVQATEESPIDTSNLALASNLSQSAVSTLSTTSGATTAKQTSTPNPGFPNIVKPVVAELEASDGGVNVTVVKGDRNAGTLVHNISSTSATPPASNMSVDGTGIDGDNETQSEANVHHTESTAAEAPNLSTTPSSSTASATDTDTNKADDGTELEARDGGVENSNTHTATASTTTTPASDKHTIGAFDAARNELPDPGQPGMEEQPQINNVQQFQPQPMEPDNGGLHQPDPRLPMVNSQKAPEGVQTGEGPPGVPAGDFAPAGQAPPPPNQPDRRFDGVKIQSGAVDGPRGMQGQQAPLGLVGGDPGNAKAPLGQPGLVDVAVNERGDYDDEARTQELEEDEDEDEEMFMGARDVNGNDEEEEEEEEEDYEDDNGIDGPQMFGDRFGEPGMNE